MPATTQVQSNKIILIRGSKELEASLTMLANICGQAKGKMLQELIEYYIDTRMRSDDDLVNFVRERRDKVIHHLELSKSEPKKDRGRPLKHEKDLILVENSA